MPGVCNTCLYLCMGECVVLSHVTENTAAVLTLTCWKTLLPQMLSISNQVLQLDGMLPHFS